MSAEDIVAGRVDEFPDDEGRLIEARGRQIAVFASGGSFYAIDRTCPHAGGPLEEGFVDDGFVFCPLHAYGFNLETGECVEDPTLSVACFPVRVEDGIVLVLHRPRT